MAGLKEAIQVTQQAVELTVEDHHDQLMRLNNLGTQLSIKYVSTGAIGDLNRAIQVARQAVNASP